MKNKKFEKQNATILTAIGLIIIVIDAVMIFSVKSFNKTLGSLLLILGFAIVWYASLKMDYLGDKRRKYI